MFKFVEHPENNEKPMEQKSKVKFKIMSLKVKGPMDYVPEMVCCVPSLLATSNSCCVVLYNHIFVDMFCNFLTLVLYYDVICSLWT